MSCRPLDLPRAPAGMFSVRAKEFSTPDRKFLASVRKFPTSVRKFPTSVRKFPTSVRKFPTPVGKFLRGLESFWRGSGSFRRRSESFWHGSKTFRRRSVTFRRLKMAQSLRAGKHWCQGQARSRQGKADRRVASAPAGNLPGVAPMGTLSAEVPGAGATAFSQKRRCGRKTARSTNDRQVIRNLPVVPNRCRSHHRPIQTSKTLDRPPPPGLRHSDGIQQKTRMVAQYLSNLSVRTPLNTDENVHTHAK